MWRGGSTPVGEGRQRDGLGTCRQVEAHWQAAGPRRLCDAHTVWQALGEAAATTTVNSNAQVGAQCPVCLTLESAVACRGHCAGTWRVQRGA